MIIYKLIPVEVLPNSDGTVTLADIVSSDKYPGGTNQAEIEYITVPIIKKLI